MNKIEFKSVNKKYPFVPSAAVINSSKRSGRITKYVIVIIMTHSDGLFYKVFILNSFEY